MNCFSKAMRIILLGRKVIKIYSNVSFELFYCEYKGTNINFVHIRRKELHQFSAENTSVFFLFLVLPTINLSEKRHYSTIEDVSPHYITHTILYNHSHHISAKSLQNITCYPIIKLFAPSCVSVYLLNHLDLFLWK